MLKTMVRGCFVIMMIGFAGVVFADSATANPRYVIQVDSVYDKNTDLTWARCSVGQQWKEGSGCVGMVKTFNFDEAQHQGGNGWRVPSKDELSTLIDYKQKGLTIDKVAFPDMNMGNLWYWTSTDNGAQLGWLVNFSIGYTYNGDNRSTSHAVRLVRNGK